MIPANNPLAARIAAIAPAGGIAAIGIAVLVLTGWIFDVALLKQFVPGTPSMKVISALAFVLAGAALVCTADAASDRRTRPIARLCAALVAALGAIALCEYAFGADLGIDNLLIPEAPEASQTPFPGRMALPTAIDFVLVGAALLFLDTETAPGYNRAQVCALAAAAISFLVLVGYLYGVPSLYIPQLPLWMAVPTATAFLVLSAGIMCARAHSGFMRVLTGTGGGGVVARRLIPPALVVPVLFGWLRLLGERAGHYGMEFGLSIMVVMSATVLTAIVWFAARLGYSIDVERENTARLLEQRVAARTAELAGANRELEAFSYTVSHDLRAPLRHLEGFAKLLGNRLGDDIDPKAAHYLDMIKEATADMEEMVEDLLAFSRTALEPLNARSVDLAELVREAHNELREEALGRKIDWQIGPLPAVMGDPKLLQHVVVNLLANAVKYTAPREQAQIAVEARPAGADEVVVSVRDNGVGFDPTYADRLFGVFERLHSADDFDGTGVGLATVRRIVERHGGRVWAEGEIDRGATFSFTLKRA